MPFFVSHPLHSFIPLFLSSLPLCLSCPLFSHLFTLSLSPSCPSPPFLPPSLSLSLSVSVSLSLSLSVSLSLSLSLPHVPLLPPPLIGSLSLCHTPSPRLYSSLLLHSLCVPLTHSLSLSLSLSLSVSLSHTLSVSLSSSLSHSLSL